MLTKNGGDDNKRRLSRVHYIVRCTVHHARWRNNALQTMLKKTRLATEDRRCRDAARGLSKTGQRCVADRPIKCFHFIRVWFVTHMICNLHDFIRVWFAGQGCVADRPIKCRHFIRVWFVTRMICSMYDFIRVWFATRMVSNTYNF